MKTINVLGKILVGFVFILSAIFKYISIDEFEVYVYSLNVINLNLSIVFARILVGFELFIGVLLVLNFYFKYVKKISIAILAMFSVFLIFTALFTNTDNCHCFGNVIVLSPIESIFKNVLLIILLVLLSDKNAIKLRYKGLISIVAFLASLSLPFFLSPPDFLYKEKYSKMTFLNENGVEKLIFNNVDFPLNLSEGRKVVCFYSPQCRFCKLSQGKISAMVNRHSLDPDNFVIIFWGNPNKVNDFFHESDVVFQHVFMETNDFFEITGGKMPLIILIDNKVVKQKFGYRNLDESEIVNFVSD